MRENTQRRSSRVWFPEVQTPWLCFMQHRRRSGPQLEAKRASQSRKACRLRQSTMPKRAQHDGPIPCRGSGHHATMTNELRPALPNKLGRLQSPRVRPSHPPGCVQRQALHWRSAELRLHGPPCPQLRAASAAGLEPTSASSTANSSALQGDSSSCAPLLSSCPNTFARNAAWW